MPPLVLTIPFGMPVVPDVCKIYNGSLESTGTQLIEEELSTNSFHEISFSKLNLKMLLFDI